MMHTFLVFRFVISLFLIAGNEHFISKIEVSGCLLNVGVAELHALVLLIHPFTASSI